MRDQRLHPDLAADQMIECAADVGAAVVERPLQVDLVVVDPVGVEARPRPRRAPAVEEDLAPDRRERRRRLPDLRPADALDDDVGARSAGPPPNRLDQRLDRKSVV